MALKLQGVPLEFRRDRDAAFLIAAEAAAIEHLHPLIDHVVAVGLQRFRQPFADRFR